MVKAHPWNVTVKEATAIQKELQASVRLTPLKKKITTIAGADISFDRFSPTFHAGIVVLSYPGLVIIERSVVTMDVDFPYVPGYLSFREVPPLAEAYKKLKMRPDVLVMDGHGIAHPRRLGVATHLGLVLGIPTIGCAKSKLYGEAKEPAERPGSTSPLIDPKTGETIGVYLRTKMNCKPIIVSPGNRATLEGSLEIVRACVRGYRLPEPTRFAHNFVNEYRRRFGA